MKKAVFKYPVEIGVQTVLELSGPIVHVGVQLPLRGYARHVQIWAEAEPGSLNTEKHVLEVFGTGYMVPDSAVHVGSAIDRDMVWHVYEIAQ